MNTMTTLNEIDEPGLINKMILARINQRIVNRDPNTNLPAIQSQLQATLGWMQPDANALPQLKAIKKPVLIVNGGNDIICPTINSYALFQNLPEATLNLYPDSAHGSIFQFPALFLAAAVAFFDRRRPQTGRASPPRPSPQSRPWRRDLPWKPQVTRESGPSQYRLCLSSCAQLTAPCKKPRCA